MKTATGASQVYDIDYTSALLGQNVDQDDSNATQPQEEEVCATIFKKCCFHSMFTWLCNNIYYSLILQILSSVMR